MKIRLVDFNNHIKMSQNERLINQECIVCNLSLKLVITFAHTNKTCLIRLYKSAIKRDEEDDKIMLISIINAMNDIYNVVKNININEELIISELKGVEDKIYTPMAFKAEDNNLWLKVSDMDYLTSSIGTDYTLSIDLNNKGIPLIGGW